MTDAKTDWELARHELAEDWLEKWPGSRVPPVAFKALKPLVAQHGWARVRPRWRDYLRQAEPRFVNPWRFVSTWSSWERQIPL